jgi:glycosyltransferase involved in cell wall biosynthesis
MDLSIIIPVHNEENNLLPLYKEIIENIKTIKSYEIIFVDDGSNDNSYKVLIELSKQSSKVKVIKLKSKYGQSIALKAGMDYSSGERIITLDGDGQHDPRDIPLFYKKLEQYDLVCNIRQNHKKFSTIIGNFMIKFFFNSGLSDSIGGMKGLRKEVKDEIYLYGNMHRYLPILAKWKGFKVGEQEIILRKRANGESKYSFLKGFKGFLDLLTIKFFVSYSSRPSYIFGSFGIISFLLGFIILFYLSFLKIFFLIGISQRLPLFLLGILLTLIGLNFIFFGLMADMISYNHMTQSKQKNYLIEKIIN